MLLLKLGVFLLQFCQVYSVKYLNNTPIQINEGDYLFRGAMSEKYIVINKIVVDEGDNWLTGADVYENKPGYKKLSTLKIAADQLSCTGSYRQLAVINDYVLIGCDKNKKVSVGQGSVFVFKKGNGENWELGDKLEPHEGNHKRFGGGISISDDNEIAVTARRSHTSVEDFTGMVYIFYLRQGKWTVKQKIDLPPYVNYGESVFRRYLVSIGKDYLAVVIKGFNNDRIRSNRPGKVFIYKKNADGIWMKDTTLSSPNSEEGSENFGGRMSMGGERIIVTTFDKEHVKASAYVYRVVDGKWDEANVQKITPTYNGGGKIYKMKVTIHKDLVVFVVSYWKHLGKKERFDIGYVYQYRNGKWVFIKELGDIVQDQWVKSAAIYNSDVLISLGSGTTYLVRNVYK